ncbi:MAG TPA: hypothetical protein PK384_12390 [Candidatus Latescibacteria bacterium]|nr:hypothetical protein [Candidatus Latescibacterota bacterium]
MVAEHQHHLLKVRGYNAAEVLSNRLTSELNKASETVPRPSNLSDLDAT